MFACLSLFTVPQNAGGVLRIDASGVVNCNNESLSSSSPEARVLVTVHGSYPPGKHNWHGAAASSDGTIVCVPNNVDTVLCVVPALNAAYSPSQPYDDRQKQQLVSPPEPELYILEGQSSSDIATGRHRNDGKYKYLGAMAGTDGHVYCFPSGSERVLQVDTCRRIARSVGPNLVGYERLSQNKWQNGLTSKLEGCVYAIPLAAETVLRIRTGPSSSGGEQQQSQLLNGDEPEVTTWKLPQPNNVLAKWEGGVLAKNGIIYCMPNNHKAVLQIVPPCVPSREALHRAQDEEEKERERAKAVQKQLRQQEVEKKKAEKEKKRQQRIERKNDDKKTKSLEAKGLVKMENESKTDCGASSQDEAQPHHSIQNDKADHLTHNEEFTPDGVPFNYKTGIPTLRSSAHRVKFSLDHREHNPNPKSKTGNSTNTTFLPEKLCNEDIFSYSTDEYNFHDAVIEMLKRCDESLVGTFRSLADGTCVIPRLDNFVVPPVTLTRTCQNGKLEAAQEYLSDIVDSDSEFLALFDRFVVERVLPHLKKQLCLCLLEEDNNTSSFDEPVTFYYQRPPTIRIQPGPARALVRPHHDAEYGREYYSIMTVLFACISMKLADAFYFFQTKTAN